jgi:hypothetical protein
LVPRGELDRRLDAAVVGGMLSDRHADLCSRGMREMESEKGREAVEEGRKRS